MSLISSFCAYDEVNILGEYSATFASLLEDTQAVSQALLWFQADSTEDFTK